MIAQILCSLHDATIAVSASSMSAWVASNSRATVPLVPNDTVQRVVRTMAIYLQFSLAFSRSRCFRAAQYKYQDVSGRHGGVSRHTFSRLGWFRTAFQDVSGWHSSFTGDLCARDVSLFDCSRFSVGSRCFSHFGFSRFSSCTFQSFSGFSHSG